MKIDCGRSGCKSTFETPELPVRQIEQLLYQHKWVRRGTVTGVHYYCPSHDPDSPEHSKARRKEKQQRGPRLSSACPPGCRDQPLFDLMGHDETGHRTARRLREHLVWLAYAEESGVTTSSPPDRWSDEFVRSDTPLALLLEMTGTDLRRIPGIGPKSLHRIAEVLGRID